MCLGYFYVTFNIRNTNSVALLKQYLELTSMPSYVCGVRKIASVLGQTEQQANK